MEHCKLSRRSVFFLRNRDNALKKFISLEQYDKWKYQHGFLMVFFHQELIPMAAVKRGFTTKRTHLKQTYYLK